MPLNRRDILVALVLACLVIIFFHNALILGEQFYAGDTYRYFYPLKKMAADCIRTGGAPLWNPLVHSGMPLHAALQAAVFYPFSVLFYILPFDFAFKWYIALHIIMAAAGTYFLLRRWRLDYVPSALASITYAFSGYVISFVDGLNIFSSIAWLPIVFLLFERMLEKPGILSIGLTSLAVAAQTLAGDPVSGYYTVLICGAYWMVRVAESAFRRRPRAETLMTICLLPAIAFAAFFLSYVQIGPSRELTQYSTRAIAITYSSATHHSLSLPQLFTLWAPYIFGNPIENIHDWGRIFAPHFPLVRSLYVGAVPLVLIPVAVFTLKDKRVYFFAGVLLVSLLLSLGNNTPLYKMAYNALPMLSQFRYPIKCFFATTFAASILAGFGLQYLLSRNQQNDLNLATFAPKFTLWFFGIVLAVSLLCLVLAFCDVFLFDITGRFFLRISSAEASLTATFIPHIKRQIFRAGIVFSILAAGLWIWQRGMLSRRLTGILAVAFVMLDLIPTNYHAMDTMPETFYTPPPIDSVLRADNQPFRLYRTPLDLEQNIGGLGIETQSQYYMWNRGLLSPNYGTLFGYSYTDGYESANLLWHNAFIRFMEGAPPLVRARLLGLLNVKYIFASKPIRHPDLALQSSPADNIFLYENTRCLDRAYFVPASVVASSERVALQFLASDKFDPYQMVVLVDRGGPGSLNPQHRIGEFEVSLPAGFKYGTMDIPQEFMLNNGQPPPKTLNPVEILSYSPNAVTLTIEAPSDGYVVLCDAYYPRWRVHVNGNEETLLRANSTVRAVPVRVGKSDIEFVYDGGSFRNAAFVSLAALLLCIAASAIEIFLKKRHAGR